MSDLLTPEDVERIKEVWWPNIQKLCRDYLTLWNMYNNLWEAVRDFAAAPKKSNPTGDKDVVKFIDELLNWPSHD